jgi:hypothetical protein
MIGEGMKIFRIYKLAVWLSIQNFYSHFTKVTRKCECFGRIVEPCHIRGECCIITTKLSPWREATPLIRPFFHCRMGDLLLGGLLYLLLGSVVLTWPKCDLPLVSSFLWVLPISSINKTECRDITEILLKVAIITITLIIALYSTKIWFLTVCVQKWQ